MTGKRFSLDYDVIYAVEVGEVSVMLDGKDVSNLLEVNTLKNKSVMFTNFLL